MEIQKNGEFDDDGKPKRTGNVWTGSAHVITAVIGSGVLSLAWGMAQLGWIAGVSTLLIFSCITLYTSNLLAECYRSLDGKRHCSYTDIIKNNLGQFMYRACATVRYTLLAGFTVGYTITSSISIAAIQKSNCFHRRGHEASCGGTYNPYIIGMGVVELIVSQIPNFHKLSMLSIIAAIMSFAYSSIGLGLSFARMISGPTGKTTLTGVEVGIDVSAAEKTWRVFRAFGDICFAYTYCQILVDIQDTLKASPPEVKVMKKINAISVITTTVFYMMCAFFGYAAFGNNAPGNFLTGFGFYEPFWLIDLANICIVVHLVGAYQIYVQPVYSAVESWAARTWPDSKFVNVEYPVTICGKNVFHLNFFRLVWRSAFVTMSTLIALIMPVFNDVLSLLGAIGYWPLSVFFPIQMHITRHKIKRTTLKWAGLQFINIVCLLIALAAACGAIQGLIKTLGAFKPFHYKG